MKPSPPLARLLAAMILAVVAWAAPSAAGAHEGHNAGHGAGHGHRAHRGAPIVATQASSGPAADAVVAPVVLKRTITVLAAGSVAVASLRSDDGDGAACAGSCGLCCCGAACCAPGILAAGVSLPAPSSGRAVPRPGDAAARAGLGPDALTEPPRPLA